jgi:hypothetical protein
MRRDSFAGWDRKIIPVLLGFVVFRFFVIAKDMPVGQARFKVAWVQGDLRLSIRQQLGLFNWPSRWVYDFLKHLRFATPRVLHDEGA